MKVQRKYRKYVSITIPEMQFSLEPAVEVSVTNFVEGKQQSPPDHVTGTRLSPSVLPSLRRVDVDAANQF